MTGPKPSSGAKALAYAETELGVHRVHSEAEQYRDQLDKILTDLSELYDRRRDLEFRLQDAEMEVANDEWSKHGADMAVTRLEKHIKQAINNNDTCRELREQLVKVRNDVDGLEADKTMAETNIKIAVARMVELGGYFQYLAAIKQTHAVKPINPDKDTE